MFFIKFGKEKNLKMLQKGIVHFRPLSTFEKDPTKFRGDPLEAKLLLDPNQPFLINGVPIPAPSQVSYTFDGYDSILSFSASKLDYKNCHEIDKGIFSPNEDFVQEMQQFGDYFLILSANALIDSLERRLQGEKCNYGHKSIRYNNKSNYESNTDVFQDQHFGSYNICFVKDEPQYGLQNEWRFIIDDYANQFPLIDNGGVNLQTDFSTETPIFETKLLHTLQMSGIFFKG